MLKADAIAHFKNQAGIARALDITEAAVSQWGEVIPFRSAYRLESLTKRVLKLKPELYSKSVHSRRVDQAATR